MIVETTALPGSAKRKFYGITSDGGPLFNNQEFYATIEVSGQHEPDNERYEGEIFIAVIEGKEHLISVGKGDYRFAELYDFENMSIKSQVLSVTFLSSTKVYNSRGSSINFVKDNINYVLFSFIDFFGYSNQLALKLLKFTSTDISTNNPVQKGTAVPYSIGLSVSCFVSESYYILCLYLINGYSYGFVDYFTGYIKIGVFNLA
jgi:hypothetical protein